VLFGDANWDARNVSIKSISNNYMPVYGNPVSDWWYGLLDGEQDYDPEMIVGRLSVNSLAQANDIVDKLIEYDTTDNRAWMKNFLFLTGGADNRERNFLYGYINYYYTDFIKNSSLCGMIDYVRKENNSPSSSSQGTEIRDKINNGAHWTIYIGHAASEIFELDGWSAFSLNNQSRYGILSTISCNTGAFAEPNLIYSRNEEYLLAKDKGFICVMGSTTLGFLGEHNYIVSEMINLLVDTNKRERNLGQIFNYGKSKMAKNSYQLFTLYQFNLLGDPTLRLRIGKHTDAYLSPDNIKITSENNSSQATDKQNYVTVEGNIFNYGYKNNSEFRTILIRNYNNEIDTSIIIYPSICSKEDFNFQVSIKDKPGLHSLRIIVDPDNLLDDEDITNNSYNFTIEVFKEGLLKLDPQEYWNVSSIKPIFRVLNPIGNNTDFDYFFEIITNINDSEQTLYNADTKFSNKEQIEITGESIDWKPDINNYTKDQLIFKAKYVSKESGKVSEWLNIPFYFDADFKYGIVKHNYNTNNENFFDVFENLRINKVDSTNLIELNSQSLPVYSLGVRGIRDTNNNYTVTPYSDIEVGNEVFVQGFHDRGFNVVVYSSTPEGISTKYRLYDTWGKDASHPEGNWYKDSVAVELVKFIRDSVADDDYLIIATSNSCFRLPVYFKIFAENPNSGSIDTLFSELRKFGSRIADTLVLDSSKQGFDLSFAMMGYRGAEIGSIPEAISLVGDSAQISGNLILFNNKGKFLTKRIGTAKEWHKIRLFGKIDSIIQNINIKIYGKRENGVLDLLFNKSNFLDIDISFIDAGTYPNLLIEAEYSRNKSNIAEILNYENYGISSIFVDFTPISEISLIDKNTYLSANDLLRGEPLNLNFGIKNLSLRTDIDSVSLQANVLKGGSSNNYYNIVVNKLTKNESIDKKIAIKTDNLDKTNPVIIDLNGNKSISENYYFNNKISRELRTRPDTIKPYIRLYVDGKEHTPNDYISVLPEFIVELYDNSPLPIVDSSSISVRVNGYLHPYQRTLKSKFESVDDGSNLKARFTFSPDTLQYEDVSIIIYFYDVAGNRDTLRTTARTSLINAYINDFYSYPNPADNDLNYAISYIAPNSDAEAVIDIFDINGQKVNRISQQIKIGTNTINFLGLDFNGNSLSSSIYFYKIEIKSEFYVEPKFGKFIIIK